jgi:hypothetical protein
MKPEPPAWALDAGLPAPTPGEDFNAYCQRLGIDPAPLVDGLDARTECIANLRLADRLQRDLPRAWQAHIDARVAEHIKPERRRKLQAWAREHMPPPGDI